MPRHLCIFVSRPACLMPNVGHDRLEEEESGPSEHHEVQHLAVVAPASPLACPVSRRLRHARNGLTTPVTSTSLLW
eukprot:763329-Hanusia_phi.AAC.2